tara:strand:+ start:248 stop:472 length:225 start_codon:yes stop_codon:yes gene_type:complete
MKWLILISLTMGEPFAIKTLKFDTKNECVDYVMNPKNSDVLSIEVIAVAGFNDPVTGVACLPANRITKENKNET